MQTDLIGTGIQSLVRQLFIFISAVAMWTVTPVAAQIVNPTNCAEDGGFQLCNPGVVTPWTYGDCDDFPVTVQRESAWCAAGGGTHFNNVDGSCPGFTPFTEDNLVERAIAFENIIHGTNNATLQSDSGWGATFPNSGNNCGGGNGPAFHQGYYTNDSRLLIVAGDRIIASKGRGVECPIGTGFENSSYFTARGALCSRPLEPCLDCQIKQTLAAASGSGAGVGNPITPGVGVKIEAETDYQRPGGLQLTRYYHSLRFAEPYTLANDSHSENRFDIVWRSNFDKRVIPIPASVSTFVTASLTLPSGDIQYFDPAGNEEFNYGGSTSHLLTTSAGYYYLGPDRTEFYGTDGRLRSISMRTGEIYTLTYSDGTTGPNGGFQVDGVGNLTTTPLPANLLLRVSDAYGNALSFTYNGASHIVTTIDPAGGRYLYSYDASQHVSAVTFPDGSTRKYLYNESGSVAGNVSVQHALTSVVDENGSLYASFKYDANGFAVSTQHAGGADSYQLSFPAASQNQIASTTTTGVTDPLGTTRTFSFSNAGGLRRFIGSTQPGGTGYGTGISNRTTDANGNTTSQTDFNNVTTCYAYDIARNVETVRVEGLASTVTCSSVVADGSALPAGSRKILTQWHPRWGVPIAVSEPGRRTSYLYNGDQGGAVSCAPVNAVIADGSPSGQPIGVLCSKTVQATNDIFDGGLGFNSVLQGVPRTWTYTYDANGKILTMDGPRTDAPDITTYTYDSLGNVSSITNALGQVTQITAHNPHGQPLTIVDPNGLTTNFTYDPRMRLTSRSVGGETTSYTYDGVGQLILVTLPDGSSLAYARHEDNQSSC